MENLYDGNKIIFDKELEIPNISKERIQELYKKIKPIVVVNGIKYFLREFTSEELESEAYAFHKYDDKRDAVRKEQLQAVRDFLCLHEFRNKYFFVPSIAEVLAQMPEEIIDDVNAFEIIEQPETVKDLDKYKEITDKGFHLSKVRTYKKR